MSAARRARYQCTLLGLRGLAGEASTLNVDQFADLNRSEFDRYGKLVKAANIKAE